MEPGMIRGRDNGRLLWISLPSSDDPPALGITNIDCSYCEPACD